MAGLDFGASLLFLTIGYLIGSVLFGLILPRLVKKVDIRNYGSGNAGATNVARSFGKSLGAAVLILDLAKPVLAMSLAYLIRTTLHQSWAVGGVVQLAGLGAIIGHAYPLYFRFKGGKASATMFGFHFAISWPLFFAFILIFLATLAWKRRVSLSSIVTPFFTLPVQIGLSAPGYLTQPWASLLIDNYYPWWVSSICLALAALLVLFKHRSNVKRLLRGDEAAFSVAKNK